ncbi:hypothetical protein H4Q26_009720 [Puccinia striiformis f. sp. tritici PST-130]|nr:hypothetical protein H4Q26_009720 [Puccinia striiformis f. sp. tritici PST-130]
MALSNELLLLVQSIIIHLYHQKIPNWIDWVDQIRRMKIGTTVDQDSLSEIEIVGILSFDSSTRRAQPELEIVLQVFKSSDVRYSRTLLLSLYGATAEIAMSWQTHTPLIDDVISLLVYGNPKPSPVPIPEENHHHHHHHSSSSDFAISRDKLQIDQESCSSSSQTNNTLYQSTSSSSDLA